MTGWLALLALVVTANAQGKSHWQDFEMFSCLHCESFALCSLPLLINQRLDSFLLVSNISLHVQAVSSRMVVANQFKCSRVMPTSHNRKHSSQDTVDLLRRHLRRLPHTVSQRQ